METIFDHNITGEEFKKVAPHCENKDAYLPLVDQDEAYMDIALLYYYREDYKKAKNYGMKIQNLSLRNSFFRTITHP